MSQAALPFDSGYEALPFSGTAVIVKRAPVRLSAAD